ncbi:MAG: TetR/AcrR family transcriptional regulator [Bacteroidia bacterium]|nr:TetR/AcrR family transcriptional regulator [Bacteroidia bacterium]
MSPRTKKQFDEIREQSREKILKAALELFAEQGYHNTSIEQIRKKAEVSKGLIYNYFETKEQLLNDLVADSMAEGESYIEEMSALTTAREKLRYIIDLSFHFIVERAQYYRLLTALALQVDHFPHLKGVVIGKYYGLMPMLESLFAEIGIPRTKEEASLFAAIIDGVGIEYCVLKEALPVDNIKNYLIEKYVNFSS